MPPPLDPSPARSRAGDADDAGGSGGTGAGLEGSHVLAANPRQQVWSGLDHGTIMGTELVVGILLWTFIGHLVDGWLGTAPWFLVIGGLVGFAAGLYLVFLRSGRMEAAERARRGGDDAR